MKGTLEQAASSPEARRLAEIAVRVDRSTGSAEIKGSGSIILIPDWAKSMKPVSGKAHFETEVTNSHKAIPDGTQYIQFPGLVDNRPRYITYGKPTYLDGHGNKI